MTWNTQDLEINDNQKVYINGEAIDLEYSCGPELADEILTLTSAENLGKFNLYDADQVMVERNAIEDGKFRFPLRVEAINHAA